MSRSPDHPEPGALGHEAPACPDDPALDALRGGDDPAGLAAHVASCPACGARLAWLGLLAKDLALPVAAVPRERDDALVALLRRGAAGVRDRARSSARRRTALRGLAAAATLAAAAILGTVLHDLRHRRPAATAAERGTRAPSRPLAADVTRDGVVDVLDAFALARALESGARVDAAWDVTGDGTVSAADVDAVARVAVSLPRTS